MGKLNVLFLYLNYPLAMGTYFRRALTRRDDIDLRVVGPYSGSFIPWLNGMNLPPRYAWPGDINLPYPPTSQVVPYEYVKAQLGDWKPDLVLTADAGIHWSEKPSDGVVAHIATDPHVLDYSLPRSYSDKFFNMQKCYSVPGDVWLPYAFDPTVFHPDDFDIVDTDACLVGMPYPQRIEWVTRLQSKGLKVLFENGPVFDQARALYGRSRIGLNWSSLNDLNARVFEVMGMGICPVINRVPDLPELFKEDTDYLGFSSMDEAVEKVMWAHHHRDAADVTAYSARKDVQKHTYDARIEQILKECEF